MKSLGLIMMAAALMGHAASADDGTGNDETGIAVPQPAIAPPTEMQIAPLPMLPAQASSVADGDVREFIAIVARKEAGKPATGGIGPADKVMIIGLGRGKFPEVIGSAGISARQQTYTPPADSVAIVRFRQSRDPVMPGPSRQDLEYVQAHQLPLFVIGEWSRHIPMWEVAWTGKGVQYRSIGDVGEIGPWQE